LESLPSLPGAAIPTLASNDGRGWPEEMGFSVELTRTADGRTPDFGVRTSGSRSCRTGMPGMPDGSEEDNLLQLLESVTATTDFGLIRTTTTSDAKLMVVSWGWPSGCSWLSCWSAAAVVAAAVDWQCGATRPEDNKYSI